MGDDFQDLWARVLLDEVRQPGTHVLRTLAFLATLARADIETLRIAARLELSGALCREATGYFQADIHEPMFDHLVDLAPNAKEWAGTDPPCGMSSTNAPSYDGCRYNRVVIWLSVLESSSHE